MLLRSTALLNAAASTSLNIEREGTATITLPKATLEIKLLLVNSLIFHIQFEFKKGGNEFRQIISFVPMPFSMPQGMGPNGLRYSGFRNPDQW